MSALNYKHLRYFWAVAKTGSIARASEQLHLTPQSISGQLQELESAMGVELFRRVGRGLELTEIGQGVLRYAEQIFALGDELQAWLRDIDARHSQPFRVGVADSVPKSVAYRLVEPAMRAKAPPRLVIREGRLALLLADLAINRIDMVIADRPMPGNINVRGYSHFLGKSSVSVFGTAPLIKSLRGKFPQCLNQAPLLLPGEDTAIRGKLMQWMEAHDLRPRVVGEFDDSALMKAFGQAGAGLFIAPTAISEDVERQFHVKAVGEIPEVCEELYAISTERRVSHPAVKAVSMAAQEEIFKA
ncbi:MAG: hypothetical protein RIR70_186 [Pseudomonadota bacterium]|jgi:LysR family transcriptional activator of nhaA